jgi:uncharacterized protein
MNIMIDIVHPAHVHFFRNAIEIFNANNHQVIVVARNKDVSFKLLQAFKIPFTELGKHYKTVFGKMAGGIGLIIKFAFLCRKNKTDIVLDSGGSVYPAIATYMIGIPNISFNNTDVFKALAISKYFTSIFITPISYKRELGNRHIRINSFNELTFLHPSHLQDDKAIFTKLKIKYGTKYILLRFVSWKAAEEVNRLGHSIEEIRNAVIEFSKYGEVFISCEYELPPDLLHLHIEKNPNIEFGDMQKIERYATLFYGESGAMASESAMLGVPSFYVSHKKLGFTEELEDEYQLILNYTSKARGLKKAIELLKDDGVREEWQIKKAKMLSEKINYTDFLVWFVENYPDSSQAMHKIPKITENKFYV